MQWEKQKNGFTIVELLIVIVVIAILAAITVVAYTGIQQRARVAAVQSDLSQAVKQLEAYKVGTSTSEQYPFNLSDTKIHESNGSTFQYTYNATNNTFCLRAIKSTLSYYVTNAAPTPQVGTCTITNYATNPQASSNIAGFGTQTPTGNTFGRATGAGPNGEAAYQVSTTAAGQLRINAAISTLSAQPGNQYNASFWLSSSVAVSASSIECNFGSSWAAFPTDPITTGWKRYSAVITAPASATTLASCQLLTPGPVPAGATFLMTKVQMTAGPTLYDFADGSSPGWSWSGAANNSLSNGPAS